MSYYILSTKHTHQKDKWFTLWRHEGKGYTFFIGNAGKFEVSENAELNTERHQGSVYKDSSLIDALAKSVKYEGIDRWMLPNNERTRQILGISLSEYQAIRPYKFSK